MSSILAFGLDKGNPYGSSKKLDLTYLNKMKSQMGILLQHPLGRFHIVPIGLLYMVYILSPWKPLPLLSSIQVLNQESFKEKDLMRAGCDKTQESANSPSPASGAKWGFTSLYFVPEICNSKLPYHHVITLTTLLGDHRNWWRHGKPSRSLAFMVNLYISKYPVPTLSESSKGWFVNI